MNIQLLRQAYERARSTVEDIVHEEIALTRFQQLELQGFYIFHYGKSLHYIADQNPLLREYLLEAATGIIAVHASFSRHPYAKHMRDLHKRRALPEPLEEYTGQPSHREP